MRGWETPMSILFDSVRLFTAGAFFPRQKVLIEKGRIAAIGSRVLKSADEIIDGREKFLMPALIDAHTHMGLFEEGHLTPGEDISEFFQAITPQLRPLDGIKMRDQALEDARRAGVSVCMVCPGPTNPIAGQCSILKTNGHSADVGLIVEQAGIMMCFGEETKNTYYNQQKSPSTRMGISALIRETLMKAQDYLEQKHSKRGIRDRNIRFESLIPLLDGRVPMRAHAHRLEDVMAAVRIADEFKLKLVIEHGTEAHKVAPLLAQKGIPVVLGPALVPQIRFELREKTFESALILMNAGVDVALTCDFPGLPIESLRIVASMAIQNGLDERRAILAITENPAKILGIQSRLGQIRKGMDADVALFNGNPLDIRSKLEAIVIDGELFKF